MASVKWRRAVHKRKVADKMQIANGKQQYFYSQQNSAQIYLCCVISNGIYYAKSKLCRHV